MARLPAVTRDQLAAEDHQYFDSIVGTRGSIRGPYGVLLHTGIVGVLHDALRRKGHPAISIWANVPHYIGASPNVKASLAIVRRVLTLLDFSTDLDDLERASADFDKRVADVIASDPKVAEYVRRLEERNDEEDEAQEMPQQSGGIDASPSGDELAQELQQFLRQQRRERDNE